MKTKIFCIIGLFFCTGVFIIFRGFGYVMADSVVTPDVHFSFQNPSYVTEKNQDLNEFLCDSTKPECKINFDLSPSFTGSFSASDFTCEISGIDPLESGKCNPNTVIFSSGRTEVIFTIRNKTDPSLFSSRTIIINQLVPILIDSGSLDTTSSGTSVSDSGGIDITIISDSGATQSGILIPDILLSFQQATYLLDKNPELSEFTCDSTKPECKINFDLSPSFTGSFSASDFICQIDGITESESGKCNPSQVTFGSGEHIVTFFIREKNNPENFRSRQIAIHGFVDMSSGESDSGSFTESGIILDEISTYTGIIIPEPIIDVQSGLLPDLTCDTQECIINLTGEASFGSGFRMSDYSCSWSFSGAKTVPSLDSCNPSYVHYLPGEYDILFRISDKNTPENFKEKQAHIRNIFVPIVSVSSGGGSSNNEIIILPQAIITPQGPWSKNKYIRDRTFYCLTDDGDCSVNFTGEESVSAHLSKLKYYWDFGNGVTSTLENPSAFPMKIGSYQVVLRVVDEFGNNQESIYPVKIISSKSSAEVSTDPSVSFLSISRVNPNPIGSDVLEWIEIKNTALQSIRLDGCRLSDASGKEFFFPSGTTLAAGGIQKWYGTNTNIVLTNAKDSALLLCGMQTISRLTWDYPIPDGYILESSYENQPRISTKILGILDNGSIEIDINGTKKIIQILGIDMDIPSYFPQIRSYLEQKLIGKQVELESEKNQQETFYVWLDGENFGETLLREGLARIRSYPSFRYLKKYESAMYEAQKNKRGIWGDETLTKDLKKQMNEEKKNETDEQNEFTKEEQEEFLQKLLSQTGAKDVEYEKFSNLVTTYSAHQLKNNSVTISGKGIPKTQIRIFFIDTTIEETESGGISLSNSGIMGEVGAEGNWSLTGIILSPGTYSLVVQTKLPGFEDWITLRKKQTLTIEVVSTQTKEKKKIAKGTFQEDSTKPIFSLTLQAGRSKKIAYSGEKITCIGKTCAVNLRIEENKKGVFVYEWDFGKGNKQYGENPKSVTFSAGKYTIILKALNRETGELTIRDIPVQISPPSKIARKKKVTTKSVLTKSEKMNIKFSSPDESGMMPELPKNASVGYVFLVILSSMLFGHTVWKKYGNQKSEEGKTEN